MILSYFPYELMLANPSKATSRKGFLIRLQDRDDQFGYSDLMPWPEFGEPNYAVFLSQLNTLKDLEGNKFQSSLEAVHPVLRIAVQNAKLDLQSRKHQDFLFEDISNIENNKLIRAEEISNINELEPQVSHIKLKLGPDYQETLARVNKLSWCSKKVFRLDFNSSLAKGAALAAFNWIRENFTGRIQYIEDPCAYDSALWKELDCLIPLAADWEFDGETFVGFQYLIIKPARQDWNQLAKLCQHNNLKFVVTSSMDHSVGVLWSLKVAVELKKKYPELSQISGCDTVDQYRKDLVLNPVLKSEAGRIRYDEQARVKMESFLNSVDWLQIK